MRFFSNAVQIGVFIQKLGISRITEATIFREAETMFNSEMGQALGCSASDVPGIIHEMVTTAERQK